MSSKITSRKVLVPLASLLAAGAIVIGSGATFTSQSENPGNAFAAGTLEQTNSKDGEAILDLENLKPGDTLTGTLTITNSGTLPALMSLTETASTNNFSQQGKLTLDIREEGATTPLFAGTFGALGDTQKITLPDNEASGLTEAWEPNESHTYVFKASLALDADDTNQGDTATATFQWDGVQVDDGVDYDMDDQ